MIPRLFHFVHLTDPDFPRAFGLHHYLCIKSCHDVHNPDAIYFYCNHEPIGEWWEKAKPYLTVVTVEPPTEIFGIPITQPAHKSDVIRLQVLLEHGGVYADMDTLFLRPYDDLWRQKCVLGMQGAEGICPAVIMSEPNGEFITQWLTGFHDHFHGGPPGSATWCTHSVNLPWRLASEFYASELTHGLVYVAPWHAFFYPLYHSDHLKLLFEMNEKFDSAYSFHLWESQSKAYLESLTVDSIMTHDTTYNVYAREFL